MKHKSHAVYTDINENKIFGESPERDRIITFLISIYSIRKLEVSEAPLRPDFWSGKSACDLQIIKSADWPW